MKTLVLCVAVLFAACAAETKPVVQPKVELPKIKIARPASATRWTVEDLPSLENDRCLVRFWNELDREVARDEPHHPCSRVEVTQ